MVEYPQHYDRVKKFLLKWFYHNSWIVQLEFSHAQRRYCFVLASESPPYFRRRAKSTTRNCVIRFGSKVTLTY